MIDLTNLKKYDIQTVFNMLGENNLTGDKLKKVDGYKKNKESINVDGHEVYVNSLRYMLFYQKGCTCVKCGRKGAFFILKNDGGKIQTSNRRHFELMSNDEVVMTKDHILPKSLGGKDVISNLQTMCEECNVAKGNNISSQDKEILGIA